MPFKIAIGDCLSLLSLMPARSVHCCVTSPPYFGLRDYGVDGQIGLEDTPEAYISRLVDVFREVRRVLRDDGTLWVNLGSSYASGDKTPNQSPLRQRVPSCDTHGKAPQDFQAADRACLDSCDEPQDANHCHRESSVRNGQCAAQGEQQTAQTAQDNEHLGCVQSSRQTFQPSDHQSTTDEVLLNAPDAYMIRNQPSGRKDPIRAFGRGVYRQNKSTFALDGAKGANRRSVWTVATRPFKGAHFAVFPPRACGAVHTSWLPIWWNRS